MVEVIAVVDVAAMMVMPMVEVLMMVLYLVLPMICCWLSKFETHHSSKQIYYVINKWYLCAIFGWTQAFKYLKHKSMNSHWKPNSQCLLTEMFILLLTLILARLSYLWVAMFFSMCASSRTTYCICRTRNIFRSSGELLTILYLHPKDRLMLYSV